MEIRKTRVKNVQIDTSAMIIVFMHNFWSVDNILPVNTNL